MKEIEEILPSQFFLRVQKSFYCQLRAIEKLQHQEISLNMEVASSNVGQAIITIALSQLNYNH